MKETADVDDQCRKNKWPAKAETRHVMTQYVKSNSIKYELRRKSASSGELVTAAKGNCTNIS